MQEGLVKCKVCGRQFKHINHTHLHQHNMTIDQYLSKFSVTKDTLTGTTLRKAFSRAFKGKKTGLSNPVYKQGVRESISKSVKKKWDEGAFDKRVNGMTKLVGELNHNYKPENHTPAYYAKTKYLDFLSQHEDITKCRRCGKIDTSINAHHIDEDHDNFLPSNLEPLCIPCHVLFHYGWAKRPYISITRMFEFAGAHYLPCYEGKCRNLHGHQWKLEVTLKKRVDRDTGMVMDFSLLKDVVNVHIISTLDHDLLNKHLTNPTAENLLVYCWNKLMFEGGVKGIEEISIWETSNSKACLDKKGMLSLFTTNIEAYLIQNPMEG